MPNFDAGLLGCQSGVPSVAKTHSQDGATRFVRGICLPTPKLALYHVSMRSFSAARTLLVALCAGVSATDDPFVVTFDVTLATGKKDSFDLEIQPEWAPLGAARFKELVDEEFFTSVRFFRVLPGFMAQFGIHGKPDISSTWRDRKLTGAARHSGKAWRRRRRQRPPTRDPRRVLLRE